MIKIRRGNGGAGVFVSMMLLVVAMVCATWSVTEAQTVSLTELPVLANQESGKIPPDQGRDATLFVNKTDKGASLRIGDKEYATGLYCIHGSQSWSYDLNGEYTSVVMDLGLQEGTTFVRFIGDDRQIYDSGVLPVKNHITPLIDVRGVKKLQIAVADNAVMGWNDKVAFWESGFAEASAAGCGRCTGQSGHGAAGGEDFGVGGAWTGSVGSEIHRR